ncbi:hypothetical protein CSV79_08860 [Sporosarcina sp. P13]|uniref:hypothetical protein n=1 Tax=Sporosarcina sp. P13 TaxID=2048263 RepID=UPI000C1716F9|nr:hypothetical protein [Sporosarcina sp. P13]PIC64020.1 hypothetical protein CSV79_08860 [Sporosarcina sp. P13]
MQLMLHIFQLHDHLHNRQSVLFRNLTFIQTLEQCAEKMIHDEYRKIFYLYDVVCCEMMFKKVIIHYANNQIIFSYSKSCVDMGGKVMARLQQDEITFFPLQKSFMLN